MDTTATPNTVTNPLVNYLRQRLIPEMLTRNGKLYGTSRGNEGLPHYAGTKETRRTQIANSLKDKLLSLSFVASIPTTSRTQFETKALTGYFNYFVNPSSSARPFLSSDNGKELVGNMIKGFYGAFPFVERRKLVLSLRDVTINVHLTTSAGDGNTTAPTWLLNLVDSFNNRNHQFHAALTQYAEGTERLWLIKVACYVRNIRTATSNHHESLSHPAYRAAMLLGPVLRRANVSNQFSINEPPHLDAYLLKDLETLYSFIKSCLEHMPCKKVV